VNQAVNVHSDHLEVNGARLHYEQRGAGQPVVFVPGGGVDAAHFAAVAQVLADEFRIVTYDRRGNARSPRPAGWTSTTIGEQADDLAGLIETLRLAPAVVWGSSLGGVILLDLLVRRPQLLRLGIVHEPPLLTVLPDGDQMVAQLKALAATATGPDTIHTAMRDHAHEVLGDVFERLPPELRERMYANAAVFFGVEVPGLVGYLRHVDTLTRALGDVTVPVRAVASAEGRDQPVYRVSQWLADRLGVRLHEVPGGHMPYTTRPEQTAATIRAAIHQAPFHSGSGRHSGRSTAR
jgi:pimeloyl-ACP methyl ester carboxylesterase